jgi:hypothetical protein
MELWDGIRIESQCAAQLEVVTTYAPLAEFGEKLSALLRGDIDEAVLPGEVFTE